MMSRITSFTLALLGSFATLAIPSIARASGSFVKYNATARSGSCTPQLSLSEARAVLARNGVRADTATPAETVALARGINQLQLLNGGQPSRHARGMTFQFISKSGYAQQYYKRITMSRYNSAGTANVGYVMHELGHQAGNDGLYAAYRKAVPSRAGGVGRCMVTSYCGKDYSVARERNEEFAEVWAAYITNPAMLRNKSPACNAAYNFFQSQVFPNSKPTPCHGAGAGRGRMASWEPGGSRDPAVCIDERRSAGGNVRYLRDLSERIGDAAHAQENARGVRRCGFFAWLGGQCKWGEVLSAGS